ncbi:MAG TPA: AI-2E family transporter [Anaerolineales bacterium]|nr:AI-2E family transporter [Anaerolineales bacterium]
MIPRENWSPTFRYVVGITGLVLLIALLIYARDAVANLAVAAFVAYLINPAVTYLMTRTRMERGAAVNLVYFSAVLLLIGLPATLLPIFYDEAQIIIADLLNLTDQIRITLSHPIRFFGLTFHLEEWGQSIFQVQNAVLSPLPDQTLQLLETTSVGVLWFLVILVSVHLFLSQWPTLRDWLIDLAPPSYRPEMQELYSRIRNVWMAYLRGQIVLMFIVGVAFTIAWVILGIPGALVLGMIAGFFTLVPDVGPFLAVVIAAGVALLEGSTWIPLSNFWVAGIVIIVYLVLINLKNFFLRPYIMGRSVHMNEALVFISIMIATILQGILGALLVVPVLASVVVIGSYVQRRVLGLPPFADDGSRQFVIPPEEVQTPRRRWSRRERRERLEKGNLSNTPASDAAHLGESSSNEHPAQENIKE